ncbi:hypothetical protein AX17_002842 [Amanita inopinata Kibby_2008]|nr:hypothetical protein AX17_002842 [Amanita inopinata Kibby_2008]
MRFIAALTALAAATAVSAKDIAITVGQNGTLTFTPANVTAAAGDVLAFSFVSKNHTVTQSTFANPCTKKGATAVDSGFLPVGSDAAAAPPTYNVTVNGTDPLWFYCAQTRPASHCQLGMVFAVNAPANESFAQFQAAAKAGGGNSTSGNGTSTSSAATPSRTNAAVTLGSNAAGLLAILGLAAGLTL